MAKKNKFHVVFVGRKPGVYDNWEETLAQVEGFPFNDHQGFSTRQEAERAYALFDKTKQADLMEKSRQKTLYLEEYSLWAAMHEEITGQVVKKWF